MKKIVCSILLLLTIINNANAHGIWLEHDDKKNEGKLYFGEWDIDLKESGNKLDKLKAEVVYPQGILKQIVRNENHLLLTLNENKDVAVVETFEPRKGKEDELFTKNVFIAKAGRLNTESIVFFDIVPLKENSNSFKLLHNNNPLAKTKVTVLSPTKWAMEFMTDDKGEFTIQTPWKGEYLIEASLIDNTKGIENDKPFDRTKYIISLNIKVLQGITWGKPLDCK